MFTPNVNDLQFLFESVGHMILINDTQQQAIITYPPLSNDEERFIHTLERVKMGDLVTFEDEKYLIMSETITLRNGKYKARMRYCNHIIRVAGELEKVQIGTNPNTGQPIYDYIEGDPIFIPAIIENQSFTIENGQFRVGDNKIIVTVQDNDLNREKFTINSEFNSMDRDWKILNHDKTKKGLLILTCEMVSSL